MKNKLQPVAQEIIDFIDTIEPRLKRSIPEASIKGVLLRMIESSLKNARVIKMIQFPNCHLKNQSEIQQNNSLDQDLNYIILIDEWVLKNKDIAYILENIEDEKLNRGWIKSSGDEITLEGLILEFYHQFKNASKELTNLLKIN